MTPEEKQLWYNFLRNLPVTVRRQKIIGKYIVDFYISDAKLVIELDGAQHYTDEHFTADKTRDEYMTSMGLTVLRFPNSYIKYHFYDVCKIIVHHIPKLKDTDYIY